MRGGEKARECAGEVYMLGRDGMRGGRGRG